MGAAILSLALLCALTLAALPAAQAQTYTIIGNFGNNGTGVNPLYVTLDGGGNVYGTTYYGGLSYLGYGVVFKLTRHGSHWIQSVLYDFTGGADGGHPYGGVTFGPDGSLYGTAVSGGRDGEGLVFKLQPPATECTTASCHWTETVIYNFTGAADGSGPQGNIVFDRAGNLYGTTLSGGIGGNGTVYELSPAQGQWKLSVVQEFPNSSTGMEPANGVIFDQAGNLYGTTVSGGSSNDGVVYELTPGASGWTQTILHNFAGSPNDGAIGAGLAFDSHGNLFGFTEDGGYQEWGVTFELQPTGSGSYNYSVIYLFMPQPGGAPGYITVPIIDSAGNIYGSGTSGGSGNAGVVFELTPSGGGSWNFITLHDFTGPDGDEPGGNFAFDAQGNLYGCAEYGGRSGEGVVWQIMP